MSHLQYFSYPGQGVLLGKQSYYSQAVRIGSRIECAGQGGWDPKTGVVPELIETELERAFANVDLALKHAGGKGWSQVYKVTMFYTELSDEVMVAWRNTMEKWCPSHKPILTATGASSLAIPGMRFEIAVVADVRET